MDWLKLKDLNENTLYLEHLYVSKALEDEIKLRRDLEIVQDNIDIEFDAAGNLLTKLGMFKGKQGKENIKWVWKINEF